MSEIETAVVIVRPPGYEDHHPITSQNLSAALPNEQQVALVQRLFVDAGFEVSQAFAGSFAITATAELFAEKLPPLPTSRCDGWLAPAEGLLHAVTPGGPVELDDQLPGMDAAPGIDAVPGTDGGGDGGGGKTDPGARP